VLVPTTDGTATVTLSAPTASVAVHGCRHGQVRISGRCRPSTTVLGTATASGTAGQQLLLTVKPTARLKAALKRHKRLRLIATLTYRPSNGGPATVTKRTITMTAG
jgi:hypothetical protein